MNQFQIYLIGVGGQGIGLLSETILRAIDHAGIPVKSVDTHGLAQRGGTVSSHIRMGENIFSPLIMENSADLVVALEMHEALRGLQQFGKSGGALIYYQTTWQPLAVRTGKEPKVTPEILTKISSEMNSHCFSVFDSSLPDTRMQNVAVLREINKNNLIPGVWEEHFTLALADLLTGKTLDLNLELLRKTG